METDVTTTGREHSNEAMAFIDAWLTEHSWWADPRAIDFALDVRAILADPGELDDDLAEETSAAVGAAS